MKAVAFIHIEYPRYFECMVKSSEIAKKKISEMEIWGWVSRNLSRNWSAGVKCDTLNSTDLCSLIGNTQSQDFSANQISRQINFGHFEAPKTAISTIWAALKL